MKPCQKPELEGPELADRVEAGDSGWGRLALAGLGLMGAGIGVVQAQVVTPQPLMVAHRGETDHALENSLQAFRAAVDEGADAVELDIHLTSDGKLVVIHDDTLNRTYGVSGDVSQMTSDQLKALGVPMLDDVLALPAPKFLIEIKEPHQGRHLGIEKVLVDLIQRTGTQDRALVISFDEQALTTVHQLAPELTTGYLYGGKQVEPQQAKEQLGVTWLAPELSLVNQQFVDKAHAAGMKVDVWTVNRPQDLQKVSSMGVDAVTTDQVPEFQAFLAR
ncbi:MAG: glycerophosphodiester phosphodiesterase family protein [Vulcanimicrobiota bacterium]